MPPLMVAVAVAMTVTVTVVVMVMVMVTRVTRVTSVNLLAKIGTPR